MEKEDLELQNKSGNTALCLATAGGNTRMAKIMVDKNKSLLTIPGSNEMMPLYMAALFGNRGTVEYLYDNSNKMADDGWNQQNRGWVVLKCIEADLFDITLKILKDCQELAQAEGVLGVLARKPYAFNDKEPHRIRRFINSKAKIVYMFWFASEVILHAKNTIEVLPMLSLMEIGYIHGDVFSGKDSVLRSM
ncbi:Ankyrin repeat-containing protein [Artemisia annua]|uniref:Ankyrin repeat-containing protein n=1 Tax=Artemisia annua TaxID=35608 RepID=A0A2U1MHU0_ARTAN|nr:Ankyrin repeat-containing protein [Artemisia annua]